MTGPSIQTLDLVGNELTVSWDVTVDEQYKIYFSSESRAVLSNDQWREGRVSVVPDGPFISSPQTFNIEGCGSTDKCYIAITRTDGTNESDLSSTIVEVDGVEYEAVVARLTESTLSVTTNGLENIIHWRPILNDDYSVQSEIYYKINATAVDGIVISIDDATLLTTLAHSDAVDAVNTTDFPGYKQFSHQVPELYDINQAPLKYYYIIRNFYEYGASKVYTLPSITQLAIIPALEGNFLVSGTKNAKAFIRHDGSIYWANKTAENKIYSMQADGSDLTINEFILDDAYLINSFVMESDGSAIYFAYSKLVDSSLNYGIGRYDVIEDTTESGLVDSGAAPIESLIQNTDNLYFTLNATSIQKLSKQEASAGLTNMISSLSHPFSLQVNATDLFFIDDTNTNVKGLYSIPLSISLPTEATVLGGGVVPTDFVLDKVNNIIYLTEAKVVGSIQKIEINNSLDTLLEVLPNTNSATNITLVDNDIFWQDYRYVYSYNLITGEIKTLIESRYPTAPVFGVEEGSNYILYSSTNSGLHLIPKETMGSPNGIPGAVTFNLQSSNDQKIFYQWGAAQNAEAYIFVDSSGVIIENPLTGVDLSSTATTLELVGLNNGTDYSYGIQAVNISGRSSITQADVLTPSISSPTLSGLIADSTAILTIQTNNVSDRGDNVLVTIERSTSVDFEVVAKIKDSVLCDTISATLCKSGNFRSAEISDVNLISGTYYYRATFTDATSATSSVVALTIP